MKLRFALKRSLTILSMALLLHPHIFSIDSSRFGMEPGPVITGSKRVFAPDTRPITAQEPAQAAQPANPRTLLGDLSKYISQYAERPGSTRGLLERWARLTGHKTIESFKNRDGQGSAGSTTVGTAYREALSELIKAKNAAKAGAQRFGNVDASTTEGAKKATLFGALSYLQNVAERALDQERGNADIVEAANAHVQEGLAAVDDAQQKIAVKKGARAAAARPVIASDDEDGE